MLGNGIFSHGIYYETTLTGKWKKTAHTDNILVELCVYSSTVNKREVSIQWAQRNAAYVNEYLLNIQFFLSSNRKMIKSILILEFYWLNTPTNGAHKTCYWGLMVAREDRSDGFSWKKGFTLKQGGRAYKSRLKRKNIAKWLLKSAGCK